MWYNTPKSVKLEECARLALAATTKKQNNSRPNMPSSEAEGRRPAVHLTPFRVQLLFDVCFLGVHHVPTLLSSLNVRFNLSVSLT